MLQLLYTFYLNLNKVPHIVLNTIWAARAVIRLVFNTNTVNPRFAGLGIPRSPATIATIANRNFDTETPATADSPE